MTQSAVEIWVIIIALGLGTFLVRFSFLGLIGDRPLPEWVTRHLRYTAVGLLPGLVAPLVVWPSATGGDLDPARLVAAGVTIIVGYTTRSLITAIICGAIALQIGLYWLG